LAGRASADVEHQGENALFFYAAKQFGKERNGSPGTESQALGLEEFVEVAHRLGALVFLSSRGRGLADGIILQTGPFMRSASS
jgi:hypothetical protein